MDELTNNKQPDTVAVPQIKSWFCNNCKLRSLRVKQTNASSILIDDYLLLFSASSCLAIFITDLHLFMPPLSSIIVS